MGGSFSTGLVALPCLSLLAMHHDQICVRMEVGNPGTRQVERQSLGAVSKKSSSSRPHHCSVNWQVLLTYKSTLLFCRINKHLHNSTVLTLKDHCNNLNDTIVLNSCSPFQTSFLAFQMSLVDFLGPVDLMIFP